MSANRLLLNPTKTEVIWCSSHRLLHLIPVDPVRINNTLVFPVTSVRDLGVYIDADTAMTSHAVATVRSCFASLRQIRSVRRSLPRHALLTLIRALVISRVDYCNSVLAGISGRLLARLQSVLNAAARLVFKTRMREPITPLLRKLHWLGVPERIEFRLCVLAYRCLQGTALPYFASGLHRTTENSARCSLRSADTTSLLVPSTRRATLGTVRSSWLRRGRGTHCHPPCIVARH